MAVFDAIRLVKGCSLTAVRAVKLPSLHAVAVVLLLLL
jgi:hypothetical protein